MDTFDVRYLFMLHNLEWIPSNNHNVFIFPVLLVLFD